MSSEQDTEFDPERVVIRDNRKIDRDAPSPAAEEQSSAAGAPAPQEPVENVGKDSLLLEERTRDLQRVQAEYANYRKRAERDRLAAGDLAVGRALADLLPVVDDLERAKAHGDLTGALKAVADKLDATFGKLGLVAFGEVGDPFDPAIHEAVLHDESDAVTVPTCTTVMRQGYQYRDRLLRPAMVGVSDPAHRVATTPDAEATTTLEGEAAAPETQPRADEHAQPERDQPHE
jgi:molecular chaperone GrpE